MKKRIKAVTDELSEKAEHYAATGSYQQLVQQVMQTGAKAAMSRNFSLQQAEQMVSQMIAAITLARGPLPETTESNEITLK